MMRYPTIVTACVAMVAARSTPATEIVLDADDMRITTSATIKPGKYRLLDQAGNGVIHIVGNDITVDFQGAELIGCAAESSPNNYSGVGIAIRGRNITIRNVKVRGYKVGIHASSASGLMIEDVDISRNYRQRLLSTPEAEDAVDWMFPHDNDDHEWLANYGAGLYIEKSDRVTVRRVRARQGQNGIILDRVSNSRIYDNDCSFLSGWGLAMWRSSQNVITRNAFDFCVRGYSHGVYNRGQDSAGILMFEQNNENVVAENSATHCGDGFFGFGGQASLAGSARTGNNNNLLIGNDFSYAAAHGIEMTFSFDNKIINNRLVGNAICGVWGGYSQDTLIAENTIEASGEGAYGLEGGAVNIEHGRGNTVVNNRCKNNTCGVYLWWDDDTALLAKPWCKANHKGSIDNIVANNSFERDQLGIRLRETARTIVSNNSFVGVEKNIDADARSKPLPAAERIKPSIPQEYPVFGETRPVSARSHLRGRHHIIMTQWGPYDFNDVVLVPQKAFGSQRATIRVLGPPGSFSVADVNGPVRVSPTSGELPGKITVSASEPGLHAYELDIIANGTKLIAQGVLLNAEWTVKFFKWNPIDDPREHPERWSSLIAGPALEELKLPAIDFRWAGQAPSQKIPADHFGTLATTSLPLPAGDYKITTVSDDGIRLWIGTQRVIDDWTWHAPTRHEAEITLKAGLHEIRIEHFEIDGFAQLQFRIEPRPSNNVREPGGE